jgi:hypothetical protein
MGDCLMTTYKKEAGDSSQISIIKVGKIED